MVFRIFEIKKASVDDDELRRRALESLERPLVVQLTRITRQCSNEKARKTIEQLDRIWTNATERKGLRGEMHGNSNGFSPPIHVRFNVH
jgi:hypothetical protein